MLSGNTLKCEGGIPLFFCEEYHILNDFSQWRGSLNRPGAEESAGYWSVGPLNRPGAEESAS